jgi:hypothetical protein
MRIASAILASSALLSASACDDSGTSPPTESDTSQNVLTDATGDDAAAGPDEGSTPGGAPIPVTASCAYANPFSGAAECKEYTGPGWTAETAATDCEAPLLSAPAGTLTLAAPCARDNVLGTCAIATDPQLATTLVFLGTEASACAGNEVGCSFAGGTLTPAGVCAGGTEPNEPPPTPGGVFVPFEQVCKPARAGEAAGASEGGEVCTWQGISGCTEEGRKYADYGACGPVLSQRPYWPGRPAGSAGDNDPRLSDAAWKTEYDWATAQVEACACVCCHSDKHAPAAGPSGWFVEDGPIWTEGLDDDGLAVLAGWVDSTAFGAFNPDDNNGFSRDVTGIPTTDVPRMQRFLEGELGRRGLTRDSFAATQPFGGPLYAQLQYTPSACGAGEGLDAEGRLVWTGGGARYLYVLEPDASAPGVPPNLDLPEGTLWRLDVAPTDSPLASGVTPGVVPTGARQAFPKTGAPAPLVSGQTYYLYALRDIYQPLSRCLFKAP